MELSKVFGIAGIVTVILAVVAVLVIAAFNTQACPTGQHAVTITYYNVALKLPATMTVCR